MPSLVCTGERHSRLWADDVHRTGPLVGMQIKDTHLYGVEVLVGLGLWGGTQVYFMYRF